MLADVSVKYKKLFDPILLVTFLFGVPNVMSTVYKIVEELLTEQDITTGNYMLYFIPLITLLISLSPAFSAGKLAAEVQELKLVLYEKLVSEKGESRYSTLIRVFIDYVEARPLQFTVYRVIPLDARLLVVILNFCVTYLIVIMQFTHLY